MDNERFDFTSILGADEVDTLFGDPEEASEKAQEKEDSPSDEEDEKKKKEKDTAEDVDPLTLFDEEGSESVGGEKEKEVHKEKEEPKSDDGAGASPNENFYSSIANALTEEGIFPDLDDDAIKKVETAEDFRDLIEAQINAGLDAVQKRVSEALNDGVEPRDIRRYEGTLKYLASLTESSIAEESEEGERLRRNLIFQDYINRGYTQAKAQKFTDRAIEAGTDIEDAKEALQSNKEYFQGEYGKLLEDAKREAEKATEERKAEASKMKESMMKDKQLLGDIDVDMATRKKAYESVSKPVYKDPDTGEYYTALQKYQRDHGADFLKYVGLVYTLTNGFKDFDGFTKGKVKKEVKKGLRNLESVLANTRRDVGGNLNLVTSAREDPESFIGKGLKLDL